MSAIPKLFVTAATGQLGRGVIGALREHVPAAAIVAGVREASLDTPAVAALREQGIEVRVADYTQPATLANAFEGIDRLLLISGNDIGHRVPQHRHVIDAAKAAGVTLLAYTSILHADTSPLFLAEEHRDTEQALIASGVPYVLLRNGWYTEVFTWRLPAALASGVLAGASGEGRTSSAARADYARAAAVVLATEGHAGQVYELAGDASFTLGELAALARKVTGKPIVYHDMAPAAFHDASVEQGVPEPFARILSDTDAGVAQGALFDTSGTLSRLIGRPTTPYQDTIGAFLTAPSHGDGNTGHG
ncbi:SDR family oxidoreductase [Luteibacter sp. PPL552]